MHIFSVSFFLVQTYVNLPFVVISLFCNLFFLGVMGLENIDKTIRILNHMWKIRQASKIRPRHDCHSASRLDPIHRLLLCGRRRWIQPLHTSALNIRVGTYTIISFFILQPHNFPFNRNLQPLFTSWNIPTDVSLIPSILAFVQT